MNQKDLHEKVALLRDGQIVQIGDNFFQAVQVPRGYECRACEFCYLDCLCKGDVADICNELDKPLGREYYLKLASSIKHDIPI